MNKFLNHTISYYVVSITTHLILFALMIFVLDFSAKTIVLGDKTSPFIRSYVYQNRSERADQQEQKNKIQNKKLNELKDKLKNTLTNKKEIAITKQKIVEQDSIKKKKSANYSQAKMIHGEQTKELLALLHEKIQNQQRYPDTAIEMERQGRTTIKFILLTNGLVKNLRVVKSSGTESLDAAALAAVKNAMPFKQINKYIQEEKEFSIDVVFELA